MILIKTLSKHLLRETCNLVKDTLAEDLLMSKDVLPRKKLSDTRLGNPSAERELVSAVSESTPPCASSDRAHDGVNQENRNTKSEQGHQVPVQERGRNQYTEDEVRAFQRLLDQNRREVNTDLDIDQGNLSNAVMSYGSLENVYKGSIVVVIKVTKREQILQLLEDHRDGTLVKKMYTFLLKEKKHNVDNFRVQVDEEHLENMKFYFDKPELASEITYVYCPERKEWFWSPVQEPSGKIWYHCKTLIIPSQATMWADHRPADSSLAVLLKLGNIDTSTAEHLKKGCKLCEESICHPTEPSQQHITPSMFSVTLKLKWDEQSEELKALDIRKRELLNSGFLEESEAQKIMKIDMGAADSSQTLLDIMCKVAHRNKTASGSGRTPITVSVYCQTDAPDSGPFSIPMFHQ